MAASLVWSFAVAAESPDPSSTFFVDRAAESGLDFAHRNGMSGQWYAPEILGAGAAFFDYDNDGDLDIYLVQGGPLGPGAAPNSSSPASQGPGDRLLRNDWAATKGETGGRARFVDVTDEVGLDARGYGMAVAAADFDNDGWVDLYLANFGANQLWRNRGPEEGGPDAEGRIRFEDVTEAWRVDDRRWTTTITVFDFDRDGWLDLYLGNYLRFEFASHKECRASTGQRDYCHPSSFPSESDLLFRNLGTDGDGVHRGFAEISERALPDRGAHPTLGSLAADFDGDGWLDLYVANDDQPNQLWRNLGGESDRPADGALFEEVALLAGCAVDGRGQPEGSMGVDAGDFDGDGDDDLFMTHLGRQTNTLYVNREGFFRDETARRGLGSPSLPYTGFGTAFVDVDLDGWLDLVVVNGAVQALDALRRQGDPFPFHEPDALFLNRGPVGPGEDPGASVRFESVEAAESGLVPAKGRNGAGRGLAVGDVDQDGDDDLLILDNHGPARLLLGQAADHWGTERTWIGLRLVDPETGRDLLGARVGLERRDAPTLWRRVGVDGSYASSRDPRIRFGLGGAEPLRLHVHWPDGSRETFPAPTPGRYTTLMRGTSPDSPSQAREEPDREGRSP